MPGDPLSLLYFPTALMLGALHALEPGHAKTLTAAYLIGIKGTKRDAFLLGVSVASTHSVVVLGISALALWIGEESFSGQATRWLQLGSGAVVVALGFWLLLRRLRQLRLSRSPWQSPASFSFERLDADAHRLAKAPLRPHPLHAHAHDHSSMSDDEHARAHAASIPDYVKRGERPGVLQIVMFGAAGGMIPCPASISVMLLALSVGRFGRGMFAVAGFSIGLAITLVGVGLVVVTGLSRLQDHSRFSRFSRHAPLLSAVVVILSGLAALLFAH